MFGAAAFSETSFSETQDSEAVFIGSLPIIYFNSSTLTFPLDINKLSNFTLEINKIQEHSLKINKMAEFTTRR